MSKFTKALEKAQQEREMRRPPAGRSRHDEWENRAAAVRDMIEEVENELFYAQRA